MKVEADPQSLQNMVDQAGIKYFEFVTRLQLRYELDRQTGKDKIDRRVAEYEARLKEKTVVSS